MRYESPTSVDEAVNLLRDGNEAGRLLAGGTDLLVQMRLGQRSPERIVDLKKIPELRQISQDDGAFRIGAAVCCAELGEHEALRRSWPGVVEAAELIGSTQIQGRASLGGNLCNASPAADTVPALIAANATCTIAGPDGWREQAVEDIVTGPGETSLARGELVVAFRLPPRPSHSGDAYLRLIPRSEMDIAVAGAGVSLSLDANGRCNACRVAIGAVAPTAALVPAAAEALLGSFVDDDALAAAALAASDAARPIDDLRGTAAYRVRVVGVLTRRAAAIAAERARGAA